MLYDISYTRRFSLPQTTQQKSANSYCNWK